MSNMLTPGIYPEDIDKVVVMPLGSDPVAAFVGVTASGPVGVPTLITSWNEYLTIYAIGQDSAFLTNSYLAYSVYGFFQNGGKRCYIMRVTNGTVSGNTVSFNGATASAPSSASAFHKIFSAKSVGTWGNDISLVMLHSGIDTTLGTFSLQVKYNGKVVESWGNLKKGVNVEGCFADVINSESNYIKVTNLAMEAPLTDLSTATETTEFQGGIDGLSSSGSPVTDAVMAAALYNFDLYDEIRLMAIPGASDNLTASLAEYCTGRKHTIAICDGQMTSTNAQLITLRGSLNGFNAALYATWLKVVNPLSISGALISVPTCGHVCGVIARLSDSRGFWKAAAGTEAVVRGAVDVHRILTEQDTDVLNPKGINCIIPKSNTGICVWGARSCNDLFPYISDLYTNITIKKNLNDLIQPLVFEPNDSVLWSKATTICQTYLNDLYQRNAFFGDSPEQAYYVKCDADMNPPSTRNQGKLFIEVGYANKKPAEFITIRIAHELTIA